MIYRGILAVTANPGLREFALHHLDTEQRHLALINDIVPPRQRSWLLPVWRLSGWLTGAVPSCFGPRAVYATIQAVESFVDQHYADQVAAIDALLSGALGEAHGTRTASLRSLRALLEQCRLDEVTHRDDAGARWDGNGGWILNGWMWVVGFGSKRAVAVCRYA